MKINELWSTTIALGYIDRMFNMDGLKMWQRIKEKLNKLKDVPSVSFRSIIYDIAEEVK